MHIVLAEAVALRKLVMRMTEDLKGRDSTIHTPQCGASTHLFHEDRDGDRLVWQPMRVLLIVSRMIHHIILLVANS